MLTVQAVPRVQKPVLGGRASFMRGHSPVLSGWLVHAIFDQIADDAGLGERRGVAKV